MDFSCVGRSALRLEDLPPPDARVQRVVLHGNALRDVGALRAWPCTNMHTLNLSSNRLVELDCAIFQRFQHLERLDVSANALRIVHNLDRLPRLRVLALAFNCLTHTDFLDAAWPAPAETQLQTDGEAEYGTCPLQHLDLRDNGIRSLSDLAPLRKCVHMRTLRLQDAERATDEHGETVLHRRNSNPVCSHPMYAAVVLAMLPELESLDGVPVRVWRDEVTREGGAELEVASGEEGEADSDADATVEEVFTSEDQPAGDVRLVLQERHPPPPPITAQMEYFVSTPNIDEATRRFLHRLIRAQPPPGLDGAQVAPAAAASAMSSEPSVQTEPTVAAPSPRSELVEAVAVANVAVAPVIAEHPRRTTTEAETQVTDEDVGVTPLATTAATLRIENGNLRRQVAEKSEAVAALETRLAEAYAVAERRHQELEGSLRQIRERLAERDRAVIDLQHRVETSEAREQSAAQQIANLRSEKAVLQEELNARPTAESLERARARISELETAVQSLPTVDAVGAWRRRFHECQAERDQLAASIDTLQRDTSRAHAARAEAEAQLSALSSTSRDAAQRAATLQVELDTARSQLQRESQLRQLDVESHRVSVEQLTTSLTTAIARCQEAEIEARRARDRIVGVEHDAAAAERTHQQQLAAAQSTVLTLTAENDSHKRQVAELRDAVDRASQDAASRVQALRAAAEDEMRRVTHEANARLGKAKEAVDHFASKLHATETALRARAQDVQELQAQVARAHANSAQAQAQHAQVVDELNNLRQQMTSHAESSAAQLRTTVSALEQQLAAERERAEALRRERDDGSTELQHAREQLANVQNEVRVKDVMLTDANDSIRTLKRSLAAAKDAHEASESGLRDAIADLQSRLKSVAAELEEQLVARDAAVRDAAQAMEAAQVSRQVCEELEAVVQRLREEAGQVDDLRQQLAGKEAALNFVDREVAQIKAVYDARLAAVQSEAEAARQRQADAVERLHAARQDAASAATRTEALSGENARLRASLAATEQQLQVSTLRVTAVEAEMRVLLSELDATKTRAREQMRHIAAWLQQQVNLEGSLAVATAPGPSASVARGDAADTRAAASSSSVLASPILPASLNTTAQPLRAA